MEARKDEGEGVDAADSLVFVARVYSFFSALAPRALPPSFGSDPACTRLPYGSPNSGKSPRRNPHRFLYILAADPSNLAPNLETFGFPF